MIGLGLRLKLELGLRLQEFNYSGQFTVNGTKSLLQY
jgi:hypothetical protein